jgi:hypothetical protein
MRTLLAVVVALPLLQPVPQAPVAAPAKAVGSSITWIGRHAEFEKFLKTAAIVRREDLPEGVTAPRRVFFAPGGLAGSAVAKTIRPSPDVEPFDSYRSEVAAYELDKLLELDMVPPTIERTVGRDRASVQLWVENCESLRAVATTPVANPAAYSRQARRMTVFDNLINNIDRNNGNMLIDPAGNLILIDHSRAFDGRTLVRMPYEKSMTAIDRPFFEKLKALDRRAVESRVGPWVDFGTAPILLQRDAIVKRFERLIQENGEAKVIVP